MRGSLSTATLALLLMSMMTVTVLGVVRGDAETPVITVPDDYGSIQQAVDAARPGSVILVRPGVYYETLSIDKPISLIGEDPGRTIINGSLRGHVIWIKADYVKISGFTITHGTGGIYVEDSRGCWISNNRILNSYYGIYIKNSTGCVVYGNTIVQIPSGNSSAAIIEGSDNNLFEYNTIECGPYICLLVFQSNNNIVAKNTLRYVGKGERGSAARVAISVQYSSYNRLVGNSIYGDSWSSLGGVVEFGIHIHRSLGTVLERNIFRVDITREFYLLNPLYGSPVYVVDSINTTIVGNRVSTDPDVIKFISGYGKEIAHLIVIQNSNETTIAGNDIIGFKIDRSHRGSFHHNNVYTSSTSNLAVSNSFGWVWDNGYPGGGNYWGLQRDRRDFFSGPNQDRPGADGIADFPFVINRDLNYTDRYPLTKPYTEPGFKISPSASLVRLHSSSYREISVKISSINGFASPVGLSCLWVGSQPPGVGCSLDRGSVLLQPNSSVNVSLRVSADPSAPPGAYLLRVAGSGGGVADYEDILIVVQIPQPSSSAVTSAAANEAPGTVDRAFNSIIHIISAAPALVVSYTAHLIVAAVSSLTAALAAAMWRRMRRLEDMLVRLIENRASDDEDYGYSLDSGLQRFPQHQYVEVGGEGGGGLRPADDLVREVLEGDG